MSSSLPEILQANKEHAAAAAQSDKPPVAVLLGGTSGIGASVARRLVEAYDGNIQIILSSRSEEAGRQVIASLPSPPAVKYKPHAEWVRCDASSLGAVKDLAQTIKEKTSKVNYLVLTCGYLTTDGFTPTEDGLDKKLALNYYARFALTSHLLPLLRTAQGAGEPARVLSVLAPGRGGEIDLDDLGLAREAKVSGAGSLLQRPRWMREAQKAGVTYNDFGIEYLAKRNPSMSFMHAYPGFVRTPVLNTLPAPLRILLAPFMWLGMPSDTSGAYMASLLLDPKFANGSHCAGPKAGPVQSTTWAGLDATQRSAALEKLWAHTKEIAKLDE